MRVFVLLGGWVFVAVFAVGFIAGQTFEHGNCSAYTALHHISEKSP